MRIILPRFAAISAAMSIALLAGQSALAVDYCKWTDENGVVHFAEKCPENMDFERVEVEPPPPEDSILEAQQRSQALLSDLESRRQERAEEREKKSADRSARAESKMGKRERCVEAMVDLHNLREGEAMYFDEAGELHDQFSIHSSSYSGARIYIGDEEHKALIEKKQNIVQTDCVQSRDDIIERIRMLAARSDSQMCRNFHDRFLQDKQYDRSEDIEDLRSIEKTVLEICN